MSKPKIFISSTVYDFSDLRSALHYYLTELGYEVFMSERVDFPVERTLNSYDACFETIKQCQYFILLIGTRVGGKFESGISITRKEYDVAYASGTVKIIPFVRRAVWDHRERVKELALFLKKEHKSDNEIEQIAFARSKFAHDAKHVIGFINQVGHNEEMQNAIRNSTEKPRNNWIHQFENFEDIISCLRQELQIGKIEEKILIENLKDELYSNLESFRPSKIKDDIFWGFPMKSYNSLKEQVRKFNFEESDQLRRNYRIDDNASFFLIWLIVQPHIELKTAVVEKAINSGIWYDFSSGEPRITTIVIVLKKLLKELLLLKLGADKEHLSHFIQYEQERQGRKVIQGYDLLSFISYLEAYYIAIRYMQIILGYLNGKIKIAIDALEDWEADFRFLKEERYKVKQEMPTRGELDAWAECELSFVKSPAE